jgi:hypothetical protein
MRCRPSARKNAPVAATAAIAITLRPPP